jgi:hypothetical protein
MIRIVASETTIIRIEVYGRFSLGTDLVRHHDIGGTE